MNEILEIKFLAEVAQEYLNATGRYKPFNSAHEAYAVLLEEVDELWDEIRKSPAKRSITRIQDEAIQVAAMAIRLLNDIAE